MSIISIKHLTKVFSRKVRAVNGVDMEVENGEIFGFLGPSGAGKTTTLRMLATLLPIDSREAIVAGYDIKRQQGKVREHIGYVGYRGGADRLATGREDMVLQGRLYGMEEAAIKTRAGEIIHLLDNAKMAVQDNCLIRTHARRCIFEADGTFAA